MYAVGRVSAISLHTLVYDTGTDTTDLLSMTVPSGKLNSGNSYSWQVRYEDNYGDWSSYSTPTAFAIAVTLVTSGSVAGLASPDA